MMSATFISSTQTVEPRQKMYLNEHSGRLVVLLLELKGSCVADCKITLASAFLNKEAAGRHTATVIVSVSTVQCYKKKVSGQDTVRAYDKRIIFPHEDSMYIEL